MKTLTILFVASIIFAFSPGSDWLIQNTPDWVSGLIVVVGVPSAFYGLFKLLWVCARGAK